jgi:Arm DNA-binding domain
LLRTWQSCPSYCVKLDALIMSEPSNEVSDADARPTDTEVAETGTRPDLVLDNEVPGLCVRVHGNGEKSFIFVYRRDNRQHFVRIGTTPRWSPEGARRWAKELRSAVDQGHDPELYNGERQKIKPVESFIQLIAEAKQSEQ